MSYMPIIQTFHFSPYFYSQIISIGLSRKFWSGEKFGPGDQNSRKIGPPGPLFPENLGPVSQDKLSPGETVALILRSDRIS